MEQQKNSLSKVLRHDGSFFYIIELEVSNGLYKYMMTDWQGNRLGKPIIFYSHTQRSKLSKVDAEYFDNNLLSKKRLSKYLNTNLYIGGIKKVNNIPIREVKEGVIIIPNYKVYLRDINYILIEQVTQEEIKEYNIFEFINKKNVIDFKETLGLYSEKDLLNLDDELDYVLTNLLNSKRIEEKLISSNGYIGTVEKVNGEYRKVYDKLTETKIKQLKSK